MWIPTHEHDSGSLLDGLPSATQLAERLKEIGVPAGAITNHGNISSCVEFAKAMKKVGLRALLGSELYVPERDASEQNQANGHLDHLVVLAKNRDGWLNLVKATSRSNLPEFFYKKPRLDLDRLATVANSQWIVISGHPGSTISKEIWDDPKKAYRAGSVEEANGFVRADWEDRLTTSALRHQELFGRGNFFLESQLVDKDNLPAAQVLVERIRHVARKTGIPLVATADSHYARAEDAADQRILLCSMLNTNLKQVQHKLENNEEFGLSGFFRSNRYYVPSPEEMAALHEPEEIANSLKILSECSEYEILGRPVLPKFNCPDNLSEDEYLRKLCRRGWTEKILGTIPPEGQAEYAERVKRELAVLSEAKLAGYFLIVQDYVQWARAAGWKIGPGRGSGAGSLVVYLLGITEVDPIKYGLLFERFYNAGRNTADRVSLPDLDVDFPVAARDSVKDYLREKYGRNRVCGISTFGRMQGKAALKDVLRAHSACSFEEMNKIAQAIPDEPAIAGELQERGDSSTIRWALEYRADRLKDWVRLEDDGTMTGPFWQHFAQAIRLEGTKRSQGEHAAGVIISPTPLEEFCPMSRNKKSSELLAAFDMKSLEDIGGVKFDVLGISVLDKMAFAENLVRTGEMNV